MAAAMKLGGRGRAAGVSRRAHPEARATPRRAARSTGMIGAAARPRSRRASALLATSVIARRSRSGDLDDTLQRLAQERDEADRRYNEALTALDQSVDRPARRAGPVAGLRRATRSPRSTTPGTSCRRRRRPAASRGKLAGFVWRIVAPVPAAAADVQLAGWSITSTATSPRRARRTRRRSRTPRRCARTARALAEFQARLIQYLQQITALRRHPRSRRRRAARSCSTPRSAAWPRASTSAGNRPRARDAARSTRASTRSPADDEQLRAALGVVQQASLVLKREVARLSAAPGAAGGATASRAAAASGRRQPARRSRRRSTPTSTSASRISSADRARTSARGSRAICRSSRAPSDVLDIGCGRGEFLELLAGAGVSARGIDLNHEMAETCRARGLDVTEADAVGYLSALPDGSLGGLFAAQVVEHLQPAYLLAFLELAFHKLRPGGRLVLETLNPACWVAFFESYIRDITHVWPLHPETLQYLVVASGFTSADIEYRSPVADGGPAAAGRRHRGDRPGAGRPGRLVQRQRREAERPDVHVPRLRHHRPPLTDCLQNMTFQTSRTLSPSPPPSQPRSPGPGSRRRHGAQPRTPTPRRGSWDAHGRHLPRVASTRRERWRRRWLRRLRRSATRRRAC